METSGQFLNTKFIFPTLPNNLVLRENLTRRLNEGSSKKLILVYAPAGYGKSTLVNAWLRSILDSNSQNKASWLSLSQQDDDPAIFFTYLIKSLQTIDRNIGNWALSLLHTPEIPFEAVSTSLINNLTAFKLPCYIVLDDYHWISHDIIHTGLTYLIDHLPPNAQIILISREAPPLPLYRLRVYDDLVELDQQDLKFSITETGSFLKDFMGLILNDELIQVIQNKTEGWVAGLQIAALSIRNKMRNGSKNPDIFSIRFEANKTTKEYFYQEVLQQQPEDIKRFFLKTAILDRLSGPLCNELAGIQNSAEILQHLTQSNSFLIQLGDTGEWFRYHPLFAGFLTSQIDPDEIAALQRKASRWHELNGMPADAIHYAFAAGDIDNAIRILVEILPDLIKKGETTLLLNWVKKLPPKVIYENPYLATMMGWLLYQSGEGTQAAPYLMTVEQIKPDSISLHHQWYCFLVMVEIHNSKGQLKEAMEYFEKAEEISRRMNWRECSAYEIYSETLRLTGKYQQAIQSFQETIRFSREQNNLLMEAFSVQHLAGIFYQNGQIADAQILCEDFIGRLTDENGNYHPLAGYGFIPLACLYYETNQLELAGQYLETGMQLVSTVGLMKPLIRGKILQAKLFFLNGDLENTRRTLSMVQDMAHDLNHVEYLVVAAAENAELELRMGNISACERWLNSTGIDLDNTFDPLYEPLHLTYARLLIAKQDHCDAEKVLLRLEEFAISQNRNGTLIKVYILLARCYHLLENFPSTRHYLERAIRLAAPIHYFRSFLDQYIDLAPLLAMDQETAPSFVKTLINEFTKTTDYPQPIVSTDFFIRFSEREREILHWVMENNSNKEIANHLFITVGTTKWYLNNIFKKMGVKNRKEAIDLLEKIRPEKISEYLNLT